jgi:hypothetical protein
VGDAAKAPVIRSRRATAAAWASITVVSLAGAVLTILAWGDLVVSDRVSNLAAAPQQSCTPRSERWWSAEPAT